MKTKNYRAATMREALEQVKQELGEEALVLDSKRVRAGGLLGLGAKELIEVRVAVEETDAPKAEETRRPARGKSGLLSLDLTDDAPARPSTRKDEGGRRAQATYAALAARTYSKSTPAQTTKANDDRANHPNAAAGPNHPDAGARADRSDIGVELAPTAPRIVHGKPSLQAGAPAGAPADAAPPSLTTGHRGQLGDELERLRAELREVKFSLGALSARSMASGGAHGLALNADADEAVYDSPYFEAYMELASLGLAPELARRAVREAGFGAAQTSDPAATAREALTALMRSALKFGGDPLDTLTEGSAPVVAVVGPTGVGKTTTLAKLAARAALRERRRVELVTLDTYRIAAVDQLKTYAEIIGAGFHVPRSVLELDALVRRLAGEATVLIDTAGRSPNDLADQLELADYLRASDDIVKCLVLQATTHPTDAQVAARKFALYGADRLVITKLDETARPAASVGLAAEASLPLAYLCAGQRVPEDIERATPEAFAARVLRANALAAAA